VELRRPDDAPRHRAFGDQALLLPLAGVVRRSPVVLDPHDGQQHVVPHPCLARGGEQVLRDRAEEVDDLRLVLGLVVGDVDEDVGALQRVRQAAAGVRVNPRPAAERHALMPGRLQRGGGELADAPGGARDRDSHEFSSVAAPIGAIADM